MRRGDSAPWGGPPPGRPPPRARVTVTRSGALLSTGARPTRPARLACALWGLSDGKDGVYDKQIVECGAIQPLISLLIQHHAETRGFAAACLSCPCADKSAKQAILEAGGAGTLLGEGGLLPGDGSALGDGIAGAGGSAVVATKRSMAATSGRATHGRGVQAGHSELDECRIQ